MESTVKFTETRKEYNKEEVAKYCEIMHNDIKDLNKQLAESKSIVAYFNIFSITISTNLHTNYFTVSHAQ